jgi:hypothetical protein
MPVQCNVVRCRRLYLFVTDPQNSAGFEVEIRTVPRTGDPGALNVAFRQRSAARRSRMVSFVKNEQAGRSEIVEPGAKRTSVGLTDEQQ